MCGILGTINKDFDSEVLNLISHRGPDSSGIQSFEIGNNKVTFAQTRLAIVDLSEAGKQPMLSEDNKYAIVFNGEIYNHSELRKELSNINFRGYSDTETLLYYLITHGEKGIKNLNGIFAFAFLDIEHGKMIIARDHFGVKPLYFFKSGNKFAFSSEIKPLLRFTDKKIDKNALATLLRLRYVPSPHTIYQDIKKVIPGHYAVINLKNAEIKIEQLPFIEKVTETINIPFEEAVAEYGKKLENAVQRQLMSDVEVGIFLSGGIDSAVVAIIASNYYDKGKIKAFTIGFDGEYNEDEINDASHTAKILGLEHIYKKITFQNFLDTLDKTTGIVEEPLATTSVIPLYYLAGMTSEYVKVVLTGQGADEPLGGYARYKGELLRDKYPAYLFKLLPLFIKISGTKNEQLLRSAYALSEKNDIKRFAKIYSVFKPQEIYKLTGIEEKLSEETISYMYNVLGLYRKKYGVEKMMSLDMRMNLADDLLIYTDKLTMHYSLEARVPMLDLELTNFIESLPYKYRVSGKQTKIIHKEYARKILPDEIINRPKKGFQSPTNTWFKQYNNKIKELLLSQSSFTEMFDKNEVETILNQHVQGYNREKQIFLLLSIFYFLK